MPGANQTFRDFLVFDYILSNHRLCLQLIGFTLKIWFTGRSKKESVQAVCLSF